MKKTITAIALATAFAMPMAAVTAAPAAAWGVITKWLGAGGKKKIETAVAPWKKKECWKPKNLLKTHPDDCH